MQKDFKQTALTQKLEIRRAFHSSGMILSLSVGCILSVAHVIQYQILPRYLNSAVLSFIDYSEFSKIRTSAPACVADTWLGGNSFTWVSFVYFLLLPLLAALPFGTSYFSDCESGYLKNIYTRMPRKQYLTNKYIAAFLSGGVAVTVPLLLNLVCAYAFLPNLLPPIILTHNAIRANSLFYELYFSAPLLYILIFLVIDFLLGGMFACIALAASYISDYKIIVGIAPFFLQLGLHVLLTMLGKIDYSSVYFALAGYGLNQWWLFPAYFLVGTGISLLLFYRKGVKKDVF